MLPVKLLGCVEYTFRETTEDERAKYTAQPFALVDSFGDVEEWLNSEEEAEAAIERILESGLGPICVEVIHG